MSTEIPIACTLSPSDYRERMAAFAAVPELVAKLTGRRQ
ncbi:hypothetical protein LuPra_04033 [Luteitalea pratensis]|uniref:Uncharacterized protein n=1 Tax=Luteitalea pratensis TaxID=1855912 RepID=A0A143PQA1_LUTPR|nr:hypothetical protein LuPra_04033 [Luteitalea pratensis]